MKYIVGIDEVGRGPLAGPVTVGVVACEAGMYAKLRRDKRLPPRGKDSKKLSAHDREKYARVLKFLKKEGKLSFAVVHVSNTVIDSRGISHAIKKAMASGLKKLDKELKFNSQHCDVRLDGGLHAPAEFTRQRTIIKGDEKEQIIAWASILAKVYRDTLMRGYSKAFPEYGLVLNKGYGTAFHCSRIRALGLSPIHRRSFCKRFV